MADSSSDEEEENEQQEEEESDDEKQESFDGAGSGGSFPNAPMVERTPAEDAKATSSAHAEDGAIATKSKKKKKKKKKKGKKDADASEADVAGEEEEEKAEGDTKEEDNSTNSLGQEGGTVATALSVTSWLMLEVAGFLFSILKALLIWLIG
eukprot:CAMPEP_0183310452 /NCGR_PEP_ID=MMETSP0160_2-20130417/31494_1 /TAXON_ID=2839 ORGANISM="Odontella Sinensis, Strain Grunow 1884" /NCGR_SAMPLE_ID=MMETSP0160_2 /ASSEMBLY_ACC=CAM_ASM_000250 /LENGTH=151 /DNA_ID=CAMNT_0025474711 /DNA_START=1 /DNA_END=453 /DNA_ORIENTATION=+